MRISIEHNPGYSLACCRLQPGEQIRAESGAMLSMSSNISIQSSSGGIGKGVKRALFGGESFFQNLFTAEHAPGEITLAPALPGDMVQVKLDGDLLLQGSAYVASAPDIQVDTAFMGVKSLFASNRLFMLKAVGKGPLLLGAFGAIHEMNLDGEFIIDTGHLLAYESSLDFDIQRVGGWKSTLLSGEGLVCRFSGQGRLWLQTRNSAAFGHRLTPILRPIER